MLPLQEGLVWPPKKEDLERLYLVERLSAARIAGAYGITWKYKSPKVAESIILYQLKKNGIERRDPAAHVRKVTDAMVDDWVAMYLTGRSLKQIAEDLVSPVTVWNHLKARRVVLRDKVGAQIRAVSKYEKKPFRGDMIERAYLMGLRYGDLHAIKHGRAIRVRVSTTHPAMADLFDSVFSPYGYVHRYPRKAKLVGYEWTLECDLHSSFEFLLDKATVSKLESFSEPEFIAFLAGIFDAEGSFHLHKKAKWYGPEACISNGDAELLKALKSGLVKLGFHSSLVWREQQSERDGISGPSRMGRIEILSFLDAQRFAKLVPIRHEERIRRRALLLSLEFGSRAEDRMETAAKWRELSKEIGDGVHVFIEEARKRVQRQGDSSVH